MPCSTELAQRFVFLGNPLKLLLDREIAAALCDHPNLCGPAAVNCARDPSKVMSASGPHRTEGIPDKGYSIATFDLSQTT
jgi:hypothetical protein